jgi:hypothetical protein
VALDPQRGFSLERKIPLVTIKSFAMSNLRDDWLVSPFRYVLLFVVDLQIRPSLVMPQRRVILSLAAFLRQS